MIIKFEWSNGDIGFVDTNKLSAISSDKYDGVDFKFSSKELCIRSGSVCIGGVRLPCNSWDEYKFIVEKIGELMCLEMGLASDYPKPEMSRKKKSK